MLKVRLCGRPQLFPLPSWLSGEMLEGVLREARLQGFFALLDPHFTCDADEQQVAVR